MGPMKATAEATTADSGSFFATSSLRGPSSTPQVSDGHEEDKGIRGRPFRTKISLDTSISRTVFLDGGSINYTREPDWHLLVHVNVIKSIMFI